jgi:DNA polymerase-3 subunit delta'
MMYPWLKDAWSVFQSRLRSGKLAHAILIQGPEGCGKEVLARYILARMVCTAEGEYACGECRSCTLFESGAHPDSFFLRPEEGKQQIVIDQVRSTIAALTLTASFSPYKVALICPAEAMNTNAANALLKSLEEPPGDTVMILVTHDASRLPVTIRSRCQSIVVPLPLRNEAVAWLNEHAKFDDAVAREALAIAGGSPLQAIAVVEGGHVESHRRVLKELSHLLGRPGLVSRAASELSDIDAANLWAWLSNGSAELLRAIMTGGRPKWLETESNIRQKELAQLQQNADRNRVLEKTPVRQDLLLQDWLIKWSQLGT